MVTVEKATATYSKLANRQPVTQEEMDDIKEYAQRYNVNEGNS